MLKFAMFDVKSYDRPAFERYAKPMESTSNSTRRS